MSKHKDFEDLTSVSAIFQSDTFDFGKAENAFPALSNSVDQHIADLIALHNAHANAEFDASRKAGPALNYMEGTNHDDHLIGTDKGDYLAALKGNDQMLGGKGNDDLGGDQGNDRFNGGQGDDLMVDRKGGKDTFVFNAGHDDALGGTDADTFMLGKQLGTKAYTAEAVDFQLGIDHVVFYNGKPVQHIMNGFVENTEEGMHVHVTVNGKVENLIIDGFKYADYGDGTGDVWQAGASQPVSHDDQFFF